MLWHSCYWAHQQQGSTIGLRPSLKKHLTPGLDPDDAGLPKTLNIFVNYDVLSNAKDSRPLNLGGLRKYQEPDKISRL